MVEVNPPLMLYLGVPGDAFARLSGIGMVSGYVLAVFALVAGSLSLARLRRRVIRYRRAYRDAESTP